MQEITVFCWIISKDNPMDNFIIGRYTYAIFNGMCKPQYGDRNKWAYKGRFVRPYIGIHVYVLASDNASISADTVKTLCVHCHDEYFMAKGWDVS